MLNKDYTAKLLDLVDVIITKVENFSEEVHVYLELPRIKHRCPACGALTDRVHDYRMQIIKDVPLGRTTLVGLNHLLAHVARTNLQRRIGARPFGERLQVFCRHFAAENLDFQLNRIACPV